MSDTTDSQEQYDRFTALFEQARASSPDGIYAQKSDIWDNYLDNRGNYPSYSDFQNFLRHDTPFAEGIGMGKPMAQAEYEERFKAWHERYIDYVSEQDLLQWPEPDIGNPTLIEVGDASSSVLHIKNFALARVVEDAWDHVYPNRRGLKVLEIGAGYGGVAEVLLRRGFAKTYTTVDLPQNLYLGLQYLRAVFPDKTVGIVDSSSPENAPSADLRFAFPNDIEHLDEAFDVVINTSSLGEMPAETAKAYVAWISEHLKPDGLFISHNTVQARNSDEVIRDYAEYGFDKFSLAYIQPQPSPAGLTYKQHLVLALRPLNAGLAPTSNQGLSFASTLVNMGLHKELETVLKGVTDGMSPAQIAFWQKLAAMLETNSIGHAYAALAGDTEDLDCDNILEVLRGIAWTVSNEPGINHHLVKYLQRGRSPVALGQVCIALQQEPYFEDNEMLHQLVETTKDRMPTYLSNQMSLASSYRALVNLFGFFLKYVTKRM